MHASSGAYRSASLRGARQSLPQKIARAAASIKLGLQDELVLGDLDAKRDWGFAGDYVRAMWLMLQQEEPSDFIIASGEAHSVLECTEHAFARVDLDWRAHVRSDPSLGRGKAELYDLVGDPRRDSGNCSAGARRIEFAGLIALLVDAAFASIRSESVATESQA